MTVITASLVKDLREKTGAGMMDCKKALNENQGDLMQPLIGCARKAFLQPQKNRAVLPPRDWWLLPPMVEKALP